MEASSSSSQIKELEPGPVDASVLYLQPKHRSGKESLMKTNEIINPIDHSSKLKDIDYKDPRLQDHFRLAGFWKVMQIGYIRLDHPLLTSLCDRWRPETNTFHFRVGEMTITLCDVYHILGITASGRPLYIENDDDIDYFELFHELLGVLPPENEVKSRNDVSMTWFRNTFREPLSEDASALEILQRARAVILHFINSRLFTDHSKGRCSLKWLPFLRDMKQCGHYHWGSAILCYLYSELSNVAIMKTKLLGGCMTLLQVWSWINLAIGRLCVATFDDLDPEFPYGSRWDSERTWTDTPSRNVLFYRNEFDLLPDDAVTWDPYGVILREDFMFPVERDWVCKCKLILFWTFQNYVPDRVMRQFGFRSQHIPDPVIPIPSKHDNWKNFLHESLELWNNRDNFVIRERNPPTSLNEYEFWYWQITRRFILKETKREIVAYVPRAPLERDVVDGMYYALDEVDAIEHDRYDPEKVKMRCIGLRQMIHSLLGKNKLHRPSRPLILHSREAHVEVEQEEGRQMDEEQIDETQRETHGPWDTYCHQPSSSFQDPMQEEWPQWPMQQEEIIFGPSQQEEIIFGPSTQTQEQPPHQTITYARKKDKRRPWR